MLDCCACVCLDGLFGNTVSHVSYKHNHDNDSHNCFPQNPTTKCTTVLVMTENVWWVSGPHRVKCSMTQKSISPHVHEEQVAERACAANRCIAFGSEPTASYYVPAW